MIITSYKVAVRLVIVKINSSTTTRNNNSSTNSRNSMDSSRALLGMLVAVGLVIVVTVV